MPSAEDKRWQAEMDASTLSSAAEVMDDKKRRKAAIREAEKRAKMQAKVAEKLKEVFGK